MKKLFILACALAAMVIPNTAAAQVTAVAGTARVMVYAGQNPDTNESNLGPRFVRLALGTLLRDIFNGYGLNGAWNGINVVATTGLYVTINPSPSSQMGSIYQMGVDDATAVPPPPGASPNQIPADNTRIMIQATQAAATSALGPFPAPGASGHGTYYVVETQLTEADTQNQSMLFVSPSGITSYQNVNTQRQPTITYQIGTNTTSGTADCVSTFPTLPAPDSGWVEVGLVCVPHGTTQLTSANIAMFTNTQFTASAFGTVTFGGNYTQNGGGSPSVLTTHNFFGCGLNDSEGMAVDNTGLGLNTDAGHVFAVSSGANASVCGQYLLINGEGGTEVPYIEVNTTVNNASPTDEQLYPASSSGAFSVKSFSLSGSCAANTLCALTAVSVVCGNAGSPTVAIITFPQADSGLFTTSVAAAAGGGLAITFYNISGSGQSGTHHYGYVCL